MGRFINADAFASTGQGLRGYNMFACCNNNPVNRIDIDGQISAQAIKLIGGTINGGLTSAITEVAMGGTIGDVVQAFVEGEAMGFAAEMWSCLKLPIILYDVSSTIYECYKSGASLEQCLLAGAVTLVCSIFCYEDRSNLVQFTYDLVFGSG